MDNVKDTTSQSDSLKKQTKSEQNHNEQATAGGRDDRVLTPRSIYNIRIEYALPQSYHNPLGRQRSVFAGVRDDHFSTSRSAPQGKSLKNKDETVVVGQTYNQVLAPRSVDNVRSEITAPQDNRSALLTDFEESVAPGGTGDLVDSQVLAQRSVDIARKEITSPDNARNEIAAPNDNQSSLSESSKNYKWSVAAGATGDLVSMDNVRDEISVSQGNRSPSGESLTKLKETEIRESTGKGQLLTTATVNVSQHKSMKESISKQLNDQHENQITLSDPLLGVLGNVSSEIPAPHINQTPLDGSFPNTMKTAVTEGKVYHQISSPTQQNSQTPLSDPLKYLTQDGVPKHQVLAAKSLDKVRGEKADQRPMVMANNINNEKCNLLPARSMEMVPEKSPMKKRKQDKMKDVKSEYQTRQGCDRSLMNEMKSICNTTSTILDEVLIEERNLNLDVQAASCHTETNREFSHVSSDDREVQGGREVKVVNSTCCRQLLNDEELINRLSQKVLEKLFTEIHCCGPNCKSPCGGRNSYFKAQKDNNRNSE